MFIKPLRISRAKSGEKESIRAKNRVFPREIGPLWRKRIFRPLEFPKKTRREPEERIRKTRENAEKTPIGVPREMRLFSSKSSLAPTADFSQIIQASRSVSDALSK
jgi:hypothetical protein